MRCGVAGISSISTPNGVSASLMALITAAGAPMAAAFAQAFRLGDRGRARRLQMMQLDRRNFVCGRRHVIGERGGEDRAVLVVDDLLQQRVADALRDAAMHLAVGDHRVDDLAGVLRHQEFLDDDAPGLDVHLDDRDVAGVGERAGRIVVAGLADAGIDLALEAMRLRISLARHFRNRHRAIGAGNFRLAVLQHDVGLGRFQHGAGDLDQLGAHFARGDQRGAAGNHQRTAGERAPAVRRAVGIAMHDPDHVGRDAELVGDDLRQRGAQALSVRRRADARLDEAGGIDADNDGFPTRRDFHAARGKRRTAVAGALAECGKADAEMAAF